MTMLSILRYFFRKRTLYFRKKYNRVIPFGDTVVDRWEKAKLLGFGQNVSIYDSSLVLGRVEVGCDTWIGPNTILDGSGALLLIGSNCNISCGVQIYTHDTVRKTLSARKKATDVAETKIGNNCYLGPNVIVAKGVKIGDGVVIGANSLVLSDIPSKSFAYGTPALVQGNSSKFFEEIIKK